MRSLETNEWLMLNNIIYKIYTTEDFTQMRKSLLDQIKMVLDYDSADFFLAEMNGKNGLTEPVAYNCDITSADICEELDYSRGIMYSGKSIVYRETDIISDDSRVKSEYYKKVYLPNHWNYSLQMILAREKQFLGVITFYRMIGKENFQYEDIFLMDMLKDHLSYRLYKESEYKGQPGNKLTVSEASSEFGLTNRERTILSLLIEGLESDEICDEISITVNTLKKHILNIYRKLGIKNRVQMFKMIREYEK